MGERRGTKALELWCRRITEGYPGVNVQNMTTSWRDGLAFCAMIHHFRPDIMDFDSLDKDDVYGNNELAFRIAEQHLGIPALLDAEDMTSCAVPDRLSILTYLSQFYQTFGGSSPSRLALKRTTAGSDERIGPVTESPQPKIEARLGTRRDPCVICGLPVFLAEKLVISRALYHRTCFRCARCNNQLTPGNYYETEEDQYCCETCPDEEASSTTVMRQVYTEIALVDSKKSNKHSLAGSGYQRSLSDEEKSERQGLKQETVSHDTPKAEGFTVSEPMSQTAQMRLNFMTNHLLLEKNSELSLNNDQSSVSVLDESPQHFTSDTAESLNEWKCINPKPSSLSDAPASPYFNSCTSTPSRSLCFSDSHISSNISIKDAKDVKDEESNSVCDKLGSSTKDSLNDSQQLTAVSPKDVNSKNIILSEDTKDTLVIENKVTDTSQCLSLVQQKLRIFENNDMRVKKKSKVCEQIDIKNVIEKPNTYVYTSSNNKDYVKDVERADNIDLSVQALQISQVAEHKESESQEKDKVDSSKALDDNVISGESMRPRSLIEDKTLNDFSILNKTIDDIESQVVVSNVKIANDPDEDVNVIEDYPEDLNPFKDDENDSNKVKKVQMEVDKILTNPFDSSDDEVDSREVVLPQPATRSNTTGKNGQSISELPVKRRLEAPQISLNPFWSDGEDHSSDLDNNEKTTSINTPVPKPRTLKHTPEVAFVRPKSNLDREGVYASNSSIVSSGSTTTTPGGTHRKKKPAPQPPAAKELFAAELSMPSIVTTDNNISSTTASFSPHTSRIRKAKPAPPPPICTNTSYSTPDIAPLAFKETSVTELSNGSDGPKMWEDQKSNKDETNRNRQSLFTSVSEESQPYTTYSDKSAQGKWKRKKGPAPPCPMPYRRKIKVMSMKDVKLELDEIELQQQGLEKQGVHLERLIRDKCESGQPSDDSCLNMDVEELVLELFALVNEKNELFRRQAELMLLGRQQRLEEEHAEIEYQIRCLMCQPEATKTDFNKQREEALIQRLVEIVEKRNEIVECLEMDRRREVEEDRSIHRQMGLFAAKNKSDLIGDDDDLRHSSKIKKGKVKEKTKEKKSKKSHKKDADKDVDETEVKLKRHKKKWF